MSKKITCRTFLNHTVPGIGIIKHPCFSFLFLLTQLSCINQSEDKNHTIPFVSISPHVITDTVSWDTDDPAIWINPSDPGRSLIIGTDKNADGALYVFNLEGKIVKSVKGLRVPNNVDIAYGFPFRGDTVDIAVVTERLEQRIRVFSVPDLAPLDDGDLIVFNGDTERAPMGIALYKRPIDQTFFIFIGGKSGPAEGYIGQYKLEEDLKQDKLKITPLREFGKYSGKKEIESIAVDTDAGYVYYSDETAGVRKYHADPDVPDANRELALFANEGFTRDHEGISIYELNEQKGYILVSDQQANQFKIYNREGSPGNPHDHRLVKIIEVEAIESDGSEVTSIPLSPAFPSGLFVAMSNGKTFHYYSWDDIAGKDLRKKTTTIK